MANEISGFGTVITIIASNTFPVGFSITQLADDVDPLDLAAVQIADTSMGVNGDLVSWARAATLPMALNVIPGSDDDLNLQVLANANRVGQGKNAAGDVISATIVYPDLQVVQLFGGKMVTAQFGRGISSTGRQKTKGYAFSFESMV